MASGTERGGKRRAASEEVARLLVEAAADEFAAHGYDGASTRRIAEQAGAFQAQIGYHIGSKHDLWVAAVDHLFGALRVELVSAAAAVEGEDHDPVAVMAAVIRAHVRHTAEHPQLQRIMAREAAAPTDRLEHLLVHHVQPVYRKLSVAWAQVQEAGAGTTLSAAEAFVVMVSLGSAPFAERALLQPLLGEDSAAVLDVDRHADRMVTILLGDRER